MNIYSKRNDIMRLSVSVLAGLALVLCQIVPAAAQDTSTDAGPVISLAGQQIMRIRTSAGGFSPEQRAEAIRQRLVPILSMRHLVPQDVTVQQSRPGQDASIYVRGHLLITVDRALAQANSGDTPEALAGAWAAKLRLVLPQVGVEVNHQGV